MASKTLIILGMLATAFAAPSGYGHAHSGSGVRPTGSVKSHHHPSGTKVSSHVKTRSAVETAQISSVAYQNNQVSAVGSDGCLTVTTRVQVTVTVTGDAIPSSTTTTSVAPNVQVYSSVVNKAESHGHHSHSTSAAVETSAYVAPTTTPHTTTIAAVTQHATSSAAIVPVVSIPAISVPSINILPTTTSTTAAAATTYAASTGSFYKRGIAYNDASLVKSYANTNKIGWAYNWGSSTSTLPSGIEFIPTLWGPASSFTGSWVKNAQAAIKNGASHLFSFNEPDMTSQSNMSPAVAATAYKTWMHDTFASSGAKLCAPSVTNGSPSQGYGLGWLASFLTACKDCKVDCINVHWYGTDVSDLKSHVTQAISQASAAGIKEVFLTEFGLNGSPSADTVATFLDTALPWLDDQASLTGYSYFMLSQGVLVNGNSLNAAGQTYMTSS